MKWRLTSTHTMVDDAEANKHLAREQRKPWTYECRSTALLPAGSPARQTRPVVSRIEVECRTDGHDTSGVYLAVGYVVMALDVIEVDRLGDPGLLI
jgi:hypothetical protein